MFIFTCIIIPKKIVTVYCTLVQYAFAKSYYAQRLWYKKRKGRVPAKDGNTRPSLDTITAGLLGAADQEIEAGHIPEAALIADLQ